MVNSDTELIEQARSLTDYNESIISDSQMYTLAEVAKEEVRSALGVTDLTFYGQDTYNADRALFWFLCIASKVKVGEIAGIDIDADDFSATNPGSYDNTLWFEQFQNKMDLADSDLGTTGSASRTLERTDRNYEYDRPEGGL